MKLTYKVFFVWVGGAVAIAPLLFPLPSLATKSTTEIAQIAKSVTVLIQGADTGSGVLIRQDGTSYTVLTARHVVDMQGSFNVVTASGKRYPVEAQSIRKLPGLDLAFFKFSSPEPQRVAVLGNSNTLQEGLPLYVTGFPGQGSTINALTYNFTEGQLTAYASQPQEGGYALVYTNKTLPGMSGGPVFNQDAQLVGIHGAADGQSQTLEKLNARVFMKTGFNLGIPINTFLLATNADSTPTQTVALAGKPRLERGRSPKLKLQSAHNSASTGTSVSTLPQRSAPNIERSGSGEYFIAALQQYTNGDLKAALMSCTRALQLNPQFAGAYSLRGNIRYVQQDYPGALADFTQAVQWDKNLATAYLGRGLTHSALSNPQAALSDYTASIQLSSDTLAYYNRGIVQLNLGNQAAAIQDLQKSADLALAEGNQEDYERAKEALNISGRNCQQSIRKICDR